MVIPEVSLTQLLTQRAAVGKEVKLLVTMYIPYVKSVLRSSKA
jgi:hypothetical protein